MSRAKASDQQKKVEDDARLIRLWRSYHQERRAEALTGAHGAIVREVIGLLEASSPGTLLSTMSRHDWSAVDADTRLTVLHEINEAVMRIREAHGLPPVDEGFDHEPDGVFRLAKQILFPVSPDHRHPESHQRG